MLRGAAVILTTFVVCSLHAALGPGAEIAVTPPATGTVPGTHHILATATDGTDFLSLWRDDTPGRDGVYATVVTEAGAKRPQVPLPLARNVIAYVDAVWTGASYLVSIGETVMRLNRDGAVIAPPRSVGFHVAALAWNGEQVLALVWSPTGFGAALLDAEGNVIQSNIELPAGIHMFTLNAAGDAFILAWAELLPPQETSVPIYRALATRISSEGTVSAPVELIEPTATHMSIDSASNGREVGVAVRTGYSNTSELHRFTIDAALHVAAEAPHPLAPYVDSNVDVVATPGGFTTTYFGYVPLEGTRMRTLDFGSSSPRTFEVNEGAGYGVLMETNGRAVMAFWGIYPALAATFDRSVRRVTREPFPVAVAPLRQEAPAVAGAGNTGAVAWHEQGALKLRRFDREGNALDAEPIVLSTNASSSHPPAVAFTGSMWLVAWVDMISGVTLGRVQPNGEIAGEPLTLDQPMGDLAIATNGSVAALVMSSAVDRRGIRLLRFTGEGERIDDAPIVLADARSSDDPAIAASRDGFLAVWSQSTGYTPHVYGKALDANGNPIGGDLSIANRPDRSQSAAKVASDGVGYRVVYVQYEPVQIFDPPLPDYRPEPTRVYNKRFSATGQFLDTTPGQDGAFIALGTFPAITFDGARYVTTFRKEDETTLRLYVAPLSASGTPSATPRLLVRAESHALTHAVATVGGAVWTVYSRVAPELANVQRVFLREVTEDMPTRRRGARN